MAQNSAMDIPLRFHFTIIRWFSVNGLEFSHGFSLTFSFYYDQMVF